MANLLDEMSDDIRPEGLDMRVIPKGFAYHCSPPRS